MIERCFNPACRRKLDYLRDGRVVRVIRGKDENLSVEHYWLCGRCYATHDFEFLVDGSVTLRDRSGNGHTDEFYFHDVVLPQRRSGKKIPGVNREASLRASSPRY